MDDALSKRSRAQFGTGDRDRGNDYFYGGLISLEKIGSLGVCAIANGSSEYDVLVSFRRLSDHVLGVYCECPRFEDRVPCKHLWATLRMIDIKSGLSLAGTSNLKLDFIDPDDFEIGMTREHDKETPGISYFRAKNQPKQSKTSLPIQAAQGAASQTKRDLPSPSIPVWRTKLNDVARVAHAANGAVAGRSVSESIAVQQVRNWFAVSIGDASKSERIKIQLYESKTTKDGTWSIPTKVSVARSDLPQLRDDHARKILAMLDWDLEQPNGYYVYTAQQPRSTWGIHSPICRETLEALCAEERFVWNLVGGNSLSENGIIRPELDPAWDFVIRIEPSEDANSIRVTPRLQRLKAAEDFEFRNIDQAVAVCVSGAVLFEESVGVVSQFDAKWVRGWHREGVFEVRKVK